MLMSYRSHRFERIQWDMHETRPGLDGSAKIQRFPIRAR
jgi:hypothetical protein